LHEEILRRVFECVLAEFLKVVYRAVQMRLSKQLGRGDVERGSRMMVKQVIDVPLPPDQFGAAFIHQLAKLVSR
jgi:hypothetical protein